MPGTTKVAPFSIAAPSKNTAFVWKVGPTTFNGVVDPVSYFGYNTDASGGRIDATEPVYRMCIEAHYYDGVNHTGEMYWEVSDDTFTYTCRPIFFQFNRDAANQAGLILGAYVLGATFNIKHPDASLPATGTMATFEKNVTRIYSPATNVDNELFIDTATSRSAILSLGYNAVDRVGTFKTATANKVEILVGINDAARATFHFYGKPNGGGAGAAFAVGAAENGAVGLFAVGSSPSNVKALVARAKSGQSASIFEAQDSSSNNLGGFDKNGHFNIKKNAAPADADIAASQCFLWFDSTNGAAKLKVKGKSADGTVVAGEVALA